MANGKSAYLYFLILVWLFRPGFLFSQSELLQFQVSDRKSMTPIQFGYVLVKGKNISAISDEKGFVKIKAGLQDTLVIYQMGYFLKKTTSAEVKSGNHIVLLDKKSITLEEVTVTAKTTEIFREKDNTVFLDFEFYDDYVLSLVDKGGKYNSLLLTDMAGNRILETPLKLKSDKLFKDCLDNLHLLTEDSIYQIYYDYQEIKLLPPYPISSYHSVLQHCECYHGDKYVFKVKKYQELKNLYSFYDQKSGTRKTIACVADSANIKDFNMDFDIRYFLGLRRQGLGYAYSVSEINKHIDEFREALALDPNYARLLRPVASEMKRMDSSFVLFDYTHKAAYYFSPDGNLQRKATLSGFNGIEPKVCIDNDTHHYIFSHLNNSSGILTLHRFDNARSTLSHHYHLKDFHYIRDYKIKGNYLYFINRMRTAEDVKTKIVRVYINWEKSDTR